MASISLPPGAAHPAVRADVQGLRGIAILLVVLYHAGLPGLGGGFVGVDVFFVISGFLITGLLLRESATTGRIDLPRFFARRARRLLPAALVMTVVVVLATLWVFPPMEQREIVSGARAASVYVTNHWLAGRRIDYLGGVGDANPMLHMWSLAVEEQFYLVWPFVVLLGLRWKPGRVFAGVTVLSFVACAIVSWRMQPQAFFLMPFRAWQFGAGALVQVASMRGAGRLDERASAGLGWVGLALVVGAAVGLDADRLYPGGWALVPTLGTALLLLGMHGTPRGAGAWVASWPLRRAGDVSYSWYLWHWPFLVFARVLSVQPGAATAALAVGLSLLAAIASTRWVEAPLRFAPPGWMRRSRGALGGAVAASVLVAGACTGLSAWMGTRAMDPLQREFTAAADDIPHVYAAGCHASFDGVDLPPCAFGVPGAPTTVVLFGDSHAAQWFPALDRLAHQRGWTLVTLTKSSCPAAQVPIFSEVLHRAYTECDEWRERMLRRIEAARPALVILSGAPQATRPDAWQAGVAATGGRIARAGARELWIIDSPWPGFDTRRCLARADWQGHADLLDRCAFGRDEVLAPVAAVVAAERRALAALPGARTIDLTDAICPTARCVPLRDGRPLYSDNNHIAASWSTRQSDRFAQALAGWDLPGTPPAAQAAVDKTPAAGALAPRHGGA